MFYMPRKKRDHGIRQSCVDNTQSGAAHMQGMYKARGYWTCRACRQRLPKANFRNYMRGRTKEDQDGTQVCDNCRQQKLRKRTAIAARLFLHERRRKVRRQDVIAEVRAEIARCRVAPTTQQQTSPKNPIVEARTATQRKNTQALMDPTPAIRRRKIEYQCPYCHASACSTVRNGTVHGQGIVANSFASKMAS